MLSLTHDSASLLDAERFHREADGPQGGCTELIVRLKIMSLCMNISYSPDGVASTMRQPQPYGLLSKNQTYPVTCEVFPRMNVFV